MFRKIEIKQQHFFFRKAIKHNGKPKTINTDKSVSNISALKSINKELPKNKRIKLYKTKYLNNIIEQDHRFIKKQAGPMLGFKSFRSAKKYVN